MANELAPGSEWMIDPEDGAAFIAGSEGHRIDITVYEPRCVMLTVDEETAASADVRDVLAIVDRAGLDPVRAVARDIITEVRDEFSRRGLGDPGQSLADALDRLEALL